MSHYFLDIVNGTGRLCDEDGFECKSYEDAQGRAVAGARSLLADEVLSGLMNLNGRIIILDGERRELAEVQFEDVLQIIARRSG